ncbi:DUF1810 domain-containing protein [Novosphingobium sp. Leaf2]|uniref:DUF1810 domain-containing protein n=1 Tax=Novosphingobium sp. Leaf2 TaxID=1735670 RepID=UPI00070005F4|nr:DUF1810 domain-containing protein [Novosphingobium sp. Leaf2]KQM21558.1 calpastatin [Novosphingobium sp. Leaf2]
MAADLHRFIEAQDPVYAQVREELVQGQKRTHWMWFIFPQIAGLGQSTISRRYAIEGLSEAASYLNHPLLGARLLETTQLMLGWARRRSAAAILGGVDALKFCSSMALFEIAALSAGRDADPFGHALDAFCQGRRDDRTRQILQLGPDARPT